MKVKILYENKTAYKPEFDLKKTAEKVVKYVLSKEKCPFSCEVCLSVTTAEEIREVNKEYREIDKATDVLSFPGFDFEEPAGFEAAKESDDFEYNFNQDTGNFLLGDIMICADRVISQAKEYGHSELREFAFLVAHSTLHLIGYDHMTKKEAMVMEDKQSAYLDELGITRD